MIMGVIGVCGATQGPPDATNVAEKKRAIQDLRYRFGELPTAAVEGGVTLRHNGARARKKAISRPHSLPLRRTEQYG